jgi:hypothetical protein
MLIKVIDDYLQQRPRDERKRNCFHPSSLHKSENDLYHHYLKGDGNQEFNSKTLRIFDNGHGVHERIQFYLEDAGILIQAEAPVVHSKYEICGSADGILELNNEKYVLEIKSINLWGFERLYNPKPEHILQANIYMFCLKIYKAILLYECKNNQELREFPIEIDTNVLHPVLRKIKTVQEYLIKGIEPPINSI